MTVPEKTEIRTEPAGELADDVMKQSEDLFRRGAARR
jgi:hypothetical protein